MRGGRRRTYALRNLKTDSRAIESTAAAPSSREADPYPPFNIDAKGLSDRTEKQKAKKQTKNTYIPLPIRVHVWHMRKWDEN